MPGSRARTGWGLIALGLVCLASLRGAAAAPVQHDPTKYPPIAIHLVHSDDAACQHGCPDWLALEGPIGMGSASRFAAEVRRIGTRKLPILINSPGGSVQDALAIGRLIRARHLDVVVSKTVLDTCPAGSPHCAAPDRDGAVPGKPTTAMAQCASACPFILAGGLHRYVPFGAYVGVHQFRSFETMTRVMRYYRVMSRMENGVRVEVSRTLVSVKPVSSKRISIATPERSYGEVQRYLATVGVDPSLMQLAEATPTNTIHWLSLGELEATHLDTDGMGAAAFLEHLSRPDSAAVAAPPPRATPAADKPATAVARDSTVFDGWTSTSPQRAHRDGSVVWSNEEHSFDGTAPRPTLRATLDYGPEIGTVDLRFARSPIHGETYLMTVTVHPGPADDLVGVKHVDRPVFSHWENDTGSPLEGTVVSSGEPNEFLVLVDPTAENTARLRDCEWLTLFLKMADGRSARLELQRGPAAAKAMKRWADAPRPEPDRPASPRVAEKTHESASMDARYSNGELEGEVKGNVTWSLDGSASGADPASPTLLATLDFGALVGSVEVRFVRSPTPGEGPLATVTLHPGPSSYLDGIARMFQPVVMETRDGAGKSLAGIIYSLKPDEFLMRLDAAARTTALLKEGGWMSITLQTRGIRARRLVFERGASGLEAVKRWLDAPLPQAKPPAPAASAAVRDDASFEAWGPYGRLEAKVDGGATWTAEDHSFGGEPATPTLLATVDLGPMIGWVEVRTARETAGVESYLLAVNIHPGSGDYLKDIVGIDEPFVSPEKDRSGAMLVGVVHQSAPGEFRVLLDPSASNAALLRDGGWTTINLLTGDHHIRRLMFQRGPSGVEAMKHWLNRPKPSPSS